MPATSAVGNDSKIERLILSRALARKFQPHSLLEWRRNMIGLMYLLFFSAYALISLAVVVGVVKWARKRGRSTFRWGFAAAFIMYNLVFWDWIPSIIQHEYYCRTKAGFWVYKTLDQWKMENPGVLETLKEENILDMQISKNTYEGNDRVGVNADVTLINDRFELVSHYDQKSVCGINSGVVEISRYVIDHVVDSILGEYKGYSINSGVGNIRFWKTRRCVDDPSHEHDFLKYYRILKGNNQ